MSGLLKQYIVFLVSNLRTEEKEFLHNLSKIYQIDSSKQLADVLGKKCENTGMWIHDHSGFNNWKSCPTPKALWINGDAGTGKSVMAASIVASLQNNFKDLGSKKPLVLYFFFDGKSTGRKDYLSAMRGLLHQILTFKPSCVAKVAACTSTEAFPTSTLEKCTKIIHSLIKDIPNIFLILDAVDECEVLDLDLTQHQRDKEKGHFLISLFEFRKHTPCLKFLVTSRTYPGSALAPIFKKYNPPKISLTHSQTFVKADIKKYISRELDEFDKLQSEDDPSLEVGIKEEIKTAILDQAGGMFLYAFLAWTTFRDWEDEWNPRGVKERLRKLRSLASDSGTPSMTNNPLYNFYMRILDTLPGDRRRIRKIFMWLVTAHTPMTLAELRVASAFEPDRHTSRASIKDDLALGNFGTYLKANCGALIRIVDANQTVHLVHQSVREFFLHAKHPFSFNLIDEEAYISTTCLTFLSFNDLSDSPPGTNPSNEYEEDFRLQNECHFLRYAALYWPHHAEKVLDNSDLVWNRFVSWANSDNLDLSFRIFWHHKGRGEFPRNATPMHIICYQGSEWLLARAFSARELLKWAVVDDHDSLGRTPLHWAAITGHEKVVKLLLENGADQYERDGSDSTPIELAIYFGNLQVVEVLHAGIEQHGDQSSQWVEMAVVGGHTAVVEFLLDNGADPNVPSPTSEHGSALHSAANDAHTDIVELLLVRGANPNYNCPKNGFPLQTAASAWDMGPVKVLLDKGADPNVGPGTRGTALQIASLSGSVDIVVELINRGANVNTTGGPFGSALDAAEHAGHTNIQMILMRAGAVSAGPHINRRESVLGNRADYTQALAAVGNDLKKGRQSTVKKKVNKFKTEIVAAIRSKNGRSIALFIGPCNKGLKMAVKLGREDLAEHLAGIAMTILVETIKVGWEEGFDMLLIGWSKGLPSLAKEAKWLPILQRLISSFTRDIKLLVTQGEYDEAKNQIIVTLSVYIMICGTGDLAMIELVARMGIDAFDDIMKSTKEFEKYFAEIIELFIGKWASAVKARDEAAARRISRAGYELFLLGVERKVHEVVKLMPLIVVYVQQVLDSGKPDAASWLLNEGWHGHRVVFQEQGAFSAKNIVNFGSEILIAMTQLQRSPGQNYLKSRKMIAHEFTVILKEMDSLGLLPVMEKTIRELALEKFKHSKDENHLNEQESQFLQIAEEMTVEDIGISTAMENIKEAIKKSAEFVRELKTYIPYDAQNFSHKLAFTYRESLHRNTEHKGTTLNARTAPKN